MRLYIRNLAPSITDTALRDLVTPYGRVTHVHVVLNEETGEHHGFAFVEMPDATQAQRAIAGLHGLALDGERLVVMKAYQQGDRSTPRREAPRLWP